MLPQNEAPCDSEPHTILLSKREVQVFPPEPSVPILSGRRLSNHLLPKYRLLSSKVILLSSYHKKRAPRKEVLTKHTWRANSPFQTREAQAFLPEPSVPILSGHRLFSHTWCLGKTDRRVYLFNCNSMLSSGKILVKSLLCGHVYTFLTRLSSRD